MIKLKRVYEEPSKEDGFRVLVKQLWPMGFTKERAAIDLWLKEAAPSSELRKWFGHDPAKWEEFRKRYRAELRQKKDVVSILKQKIKEGTITFVYAARDEEHNSAIVLKEILERDKGITQRSIAANKRPPCVPPSQGGTQGGCKKTFQNLSS